MKFKKFMALLLAGTMILSMSACGSEDEETNNPSSSDNEVVDNSSNSSDDVKDPVDEKPWKGTTLQIWGMNGDTYTNVDNLNVNSFMWMIASAMDEWCAENEVSIEYVTTVDVTSMSAAVNAGQTPDLIFTANTFPNLANIGLLHPLSADDYDVLAEAAGSSNWLDVVSFKGDSYGVAYPWNGMIVLTYNRSLFERYGVKTPKEYFQEGNWNWETFQTCLEEMTKDTDGDGNVDSYGINKNSMAVMRPYVIEGADGKLLSPMGEQVNKDFLEILYTGLNETGTIVNSADHIWNKVDGVMPAFYAMDNELYNANHVYHKLANGDVLEPVPFPEYTKENPEVFQKANAMYMSIAKACDNVDAVVSMMAYILECGQKYMADLYGTECEFEGIQGTTEISAEWKKQFAKRVADEKALRDSVFEYDAEYIADINEYMMGFELNMNKVYSGVTNFWGGGNPFASLLTLPPASSIAECSPVFQGQLDTYNSKYVY